MKQKERAKPQRPTYRPLSSPMIWLCWVGLTIAGALVGNSLLALSFAFTGDGGPGLYFLLASPLFFVSAFQWLLLHRLVARSGLWLLTGIAGIPFFFPYLAALFSVGDLSGSYDGGTLQVGQAIGFFILTLLFLGSIIGALQGFLVIRTYRKKRERVLWWIGANALGWLLGYSLNIGVQMGGSLFGKPWNWLSPLQQIIAFNLEETPAWLIIGLVTATALVWLTTQEPKSPSTDITAFPS